MKYTVKGRSSVVVGIVALLVMGFSFVSSLARRISVVEPRVRIERAESEDAARAATLTRMQAVRLSSTFAPRRSGLRLHRLPRTSVSGRD